MGLLSFSHKVSAVVPCEASQLYDVLTDYDAYADWLPVVSQSKLLAREGDLAIAEFGLEGPGGDKYTFECIHTRNKMVLTRRISGRAPVTQMEWTLQPDGAATRVSLEVQGRGFLPGVFSYRRFSDAGAWLQCLKAEASSGGAGVSVEAEGGEKVIEIVETEDGLVCWLRGKKYIMQPASEGKQ